MVTGGGLEHGKVLQERAREEVSELLANIPKSVLVIEKCLIGILDVLFKFSELEALGVERIVEWTSDHSDDPGPTPKVYICRSLSPQTLPLMTGLAAAIKRPTAQAIERHLWLCPFECKLATNRLEALGVDLTRDFVSVKSVSFLDFSIVENDTISLELGDELFSNYHGRGDPSMLVLVARALQQLQLQFGIGVGHSEVSPSERRIRKISSIGTASKFVADAFLRFTATGEAEIQENKQPTNDSGGEVMTGISTRIGGIESIGGLLLGPNKGHPATALGGERKNNYSVLAKHVTASDAIDSLVLIDRRTDMISLLCSQFTYESRIDDEFGIKNRRVVCPPQNGEEEVSMVLTKESDPLFAEVRDVSVSAIGQLLSKKAKFISESYKQKDSLKSISEIKDFMDKFKQIQAEHASLSNHVNLATSVSDLTKNPNYMYLLKIEDQVVSLSKPVGKVLSKIESITRRNSEDPKTFTLPRILRLLCLASQTYGAKQVTGAGLDRVLRTLVHAFGFSVIQTVHHLEQCGLLRFHNPAEASGVMAELMSSGTKWPKIREEFKLISADAQNDELAEAYSGYIPLSVRLVQLLNSSWKSNADKLSLLRGPAVEIAQECPIASAGLANATIVAVVFIGGVTYGEIAALRKLSLLEGGRRKFLIIATSITSYSRIII